MGAEGEGGQVTLESPDPGGHQGVPLHLRALRGSVPVVSPLEMAHPPPAETPEGARG